MYIPLSGEVRSHEKQVLLVGFLHEWNFKSSGSPGQGNGGSLDGKEPKKWSRNQDNECSLRSSAKKSSKWRDFSVANAEELLRDTATAQATGRSHWKNTFAKDELTNENNEMQEESTDIQLRARRSWEFHMLRFVRDRQATTFQFISPWKIELNTSKGQIGRKVLSHGSYKWRTQASRCVWKPTLHPVCVASGHSPQSSVPRFLICQVWLLMAPQWWAVRIKYLLSLNCLENCKYAWNERFL